MSVAALGNSLRSEEKLSIKNNGRTITAVVKKHDSNFTTTTETQTSSGKCFMQYLIYLVQLNALHILMLDLLDMRNLGSMSVSEELCTYSSPIPTLTLTCYYLTVVGSGEGWVYSCLGTDIDLKLVVFSRQSFDNMRTICQKVFFVIR